MREVGVSEAVEILRGGGLVAFPTETVYGLGADATQAAAVRAIFAVKGRPASHPLILHVASAADLGAVARQIPPAARRLADVLWPGPLTLVLPRTAAVLDEVTGGRDTVAVRVPRHPVAQALLAGLGRPIAAPSANRFGAVSPTTAAHVRADLSGSDVALLDGGPCEVGLESTIVAFEDGVPSVLREGGVPREELEAILGAPVPLAGGEARAPGMLAAHYAPRARVVLASEGDVDARAREAVALGRRVAVLSAGGRGVAGAETVVLSREPAELARTLYATLRALDARGVQVAVVELPPSVGLGAAVADRLRRAAADPR